MGPGHLFDITDGYTGALGQTTNPGGGGGSGGISNWNSFFTNFYNEVDWNTFFAEMDWDEFFSAFYSNIDWDQFFTEFWDNFNSPPIFDGCVLRLTSNVSNGNSTWEAIWWTGVNSVEEKDTAAFHNPSTNASRITIPVGKDGRYVFWAQMRHDWNGTGDRLYRLYVNGAATNYEVGARAPYANNFGLSLYCEMNLVAGDYVEIYCFQNSGGVLNVLAESRWGCHRVDGTFHGATLRLTSNVSNGDNTLEVITWSGGNSTEEEDTDAYHDPASNASRITIPTGASGRYVVWADMRHDFHATGDRLYRIYVNGASTSYEVGSKAPATSNFGACIYAEIELNAGDYVEIYMYQNSGGALDILAGSRFGVRLLNGTETATQSFRGCALRLTSNVTNGNNVYETVTWSAANSVEDMDTDGFHGTLNSSRITIPFGMAGRYIVWANMKHTWHGTGDRLYRIRLNGAGLDYEVGLRAPGANNLGAVLYAEVDLVEGDYLDIQAYQNSGGVLNILAGSRFGIRKLTGDTGSLPFSPLLVQLGDVEVTSLADNDILRYDSDTLKWVNTSPGSYLNAANLWVGMARNVDMISATGTHLIGTIPAGYKLIPLDIRMRCVAITGAAGSAGVSIGTENPTYANIRTGTTAYTVSTADAFASLTLSGATAVSGDVTLWIQSVGLSTTQTIDWLVFGLLVPA